MFHYVYFFLYICELLTSPCTLCSSSVLALSCVKLPYTSDTVSCLCILLSKSWHVISLVLLSPIPKLVLLFSVVSRLFFTLCSRIILPSYILKNAHSNKIIKLTLDFYMNLQRVDILTILNIFICDCVIFLYLLRFSLLSFNKKFIIFFTKVLYIFCKKLFFSFRFFMII